MESVIFHCDINSFYAQVELLDHPELKDLPVAVCGDPEQRHGVILAKNERAKAEGVFTGQTVWQAKKSSPELVFLRSNGEKYRHFSKKANELYLQYSDLVEPYGVDESWIDVTGSLHLFGKSPVALADEIRRRSVEEFGLTLSIGVSFNKIFAKLGSDYKKPDATTEIRRDNFREKIWHLPVGDLLFVGKVAEKTLKKYGVTTIGALANFDAEALTVILGKQGAMLHRYANGEDTSPVRHFLDVEPPKTVGQGLTFAQNLVGEEEVHSGIVMLSDHVALRLRSHGLVCQGVQIQLRDPCFHNISRQTRLDNPTSFSHDIVETACKLAKENWNFVVAVRAISITAIQLLPEEESGAQLSIFEPEDPNREKMERLALATDKIREKFGRLSIGPASAPQKKRRNCSIGFSLDETAD